MPFPNRKEFDAVFPTIVRYVGIGLVVFFAVASSLGIHLPESILVAASGLILYKTVKGSNGNGNGNGNGSR